MPDFGKRLGAGAVGVYAADKPDGDISSAALSATGRALLDEAHSVYAQKNGGAPMSIPALAGFVRSAEQSSGRQPGARPDLDGAA